MAPAERSDVVVRAASRFSLARAGAVLMTDQASSFASAAIQLNKVHLLCSHHFRTAMFSAHSGLSQVERDRFLKLCNALIFHDYLQPETLTNQFNLLRSEFGRYPGALKFIASL